MRRSATGGSSTRPRCALRWQASMTSSRRSGLRALFERRHEVTTAMPMPRGDVRVAYWHVVLQTPKMSARRLFSVGLRRIRNEDTARDFVDRGGGTRSHYGRGRAGRGGEKLKSLASGVAGNCEDRGRD